jgi:hypothetical protein
LQATKSTRRQREAVEDIRAAYRTIILAYYVRTLPSTIEHSSLVEPYWRWGPSRYVRRSSGSQPARFKVKTFCSTRIACESCVHKLCTTLGDEMFHVVACYPYATGRDSLLARFREVRGNCWCLSFLSSNVRQYCKACHGREL